MSDLASVMAPDWAEAMEPVAEQIAAMGDFLRREIAAGHGYLPPGDAVLRAFAEPMVGVKVLIVGQDPYPTPGHSMGLAFSVASEVRPLPRSLGNIYRELEADLHLPAPSTGDLRPWAAQGVMLLNRVLTVRPGFTASHRGEGWEQITEHAITTLVRRQLPLVAVLWGREAQRLTPYLGETPIIASPHPSPLSAARGFFGSRPFSRVNSSLVGQGAEPVDWGLRG